MRKALIGTLAAFLVGAACSDSAPGPDSGSAAETTVTFQVQGEPEEIVVYQGLVDTFAEQRPNIAVEIVEVPEEQDALAKLSTQFAAGDPPDIFLINYREYAQFAAQGAIEPIGPHLGEAGIDIADYYDEPVAAFTFEGELQCLPQNISSLVVYYNTKLFKEAGVEPPTPGWTWADFRKTAIALTKGDVKGLALEARIIRVAPFAWSNGGEIVDDETRPTRFTFDDPATREALQFLIDLVRKDGVVPTEEEQAGEDLETRFTTGKVAMFLGSRRDTPKFREVFDLKWDVGPLPVAEQPAGILHSDAYCISRDSEHLDEALEFIAYALGEEGQAFTAFSGRIVPSLESVAESPAFLDKSQRPRNSRVFLDGIPFIRAIPVIPSWPQIEDIANEIMTRLFFEPGYTIDDAIAELDEQTAHLFGLGAGA